MLASTIILIVVRLFSVQWLVQGLAALPLSFVEMAQGQDTSRATWTLMMPVLTIVLAIVAWFLAPLLARLILGSKDTALQIPILSLVDLYAFAFAFLGIYFVLSSLAGAVNWFHYFLLVAASHSDFDPARRTSFYELSRHLITLFAGLACVFYGRRWARKILKSENDG